MSLSPIELELIKSLEDPVKHKINVRTFADCFVWSDVLVPFLALWQHYNKKDYRIDQKLFLALMCKVFGEPIQDKNGAYCYHAQYVPKETPKAITKREVILKLERVKQFLLELKNKRL